MHGLYDTHAHLDFPDFGADLEGVLDRAKAAGVTKIVSIGTDLESSARAVALAERFPQIYAAVGWHPAHALEAPVDIRDDLVRLAAHPKVVAIGETGLDHHHLPSRRSGGTVEEDERYRTRQVELFRQQLDVAAALSLNVVVHEREAFDPAIEILAPYSQRLRGVFHCFSGTPERVARLMTLNCLVSFTGILTFKNGDNIRQALRATPPDRFMMETDCPYLAPVPLRGKRCEPAHVRHTAECAAVVRGWTYELLAEQTSQTADLFFPKLAN
jgi:TatD DNase family protein